MLEPLHRFPVAARRAVRAVLTDIDDTLTDHGRLPVIAYDAMTRLQKAGICVVPVTGRPAGWCDLIARQWPITGVVGENGAFFFRYDDATRTMTRRYAKDEPARSADRRRLDQIRQAVLAQVPGAAVSADQAYRDADLAIDFCEDVAPLPASAVKRIVEIFEQSGATAKISSIHVNGWFGGYDKLTTSKTFLREVLGAGRGRQPGNHRLYRRQPQRCPDVRGSSVIPSVSRMCSISAPSWRRRRAGSPRIGVGMDSRNLPTRSSRHGNRDCEASGGLEDPPIPVCGSPDRRLPF